MRTAPLRRLPKLALPALILICVVAVGAFASLGAAPNGYQEVRFDQIHPSQAAVVDWEIFASTCHTAKCEEKFGVYGNDQDIYIKMRLVKLNRGRSDPNEGNYRLSKAAMNKIKKGPSYVTVNMDGRTYKAPFLKSIKRHTLVFKYDISDDDGVDDGGAWCSGNGRGKKDLDGIGLQDFRSHGCAPSNRAHMLGGEYYRQFYADRSSTFPRYKVDKSTTDIEVNSTLDNGLCKKPKRKPSEGDNSISAAVHYQCSSLLAVGEGINGVNWSEDLPIHKWTGVTREVGRGRIVQLDLTSRAYTVTKRGKGVHQGPLMRLVGGRSGGLSDKYPHALDSVLIPQLTIEHRPEWEAHGHSLMADSEGYVRCYYIKCDADGNGFIPENWK